PPRRCGRRTSAPAPGCGNRSPSSTATAEPETAMPPRKTGAEPHPRTPAARRTAPNSRPRRPAGEPADDEAAAPTGQRMEAPAAGVKVRMYRTGLGDCFLLAFPRHPSPGDARDVFYMLVDCGVFYGTEGGGDRIKKIAGDIKAATRKTDAQDSDSR